MSTKAHFDRFATCASEASGSVLAFATAVGLVAAWVIEGLIGSAVTGSFGYFMDNSFQLQINTATTVLTFLLVFLVQYTQNKDARAVQLKLDVLIDASEASNRYASVETLSGEELATLHAKVVEKLAENKPKAAPRPPRRKPSAPKPASS